MVPEADALLAGAAPGGAAEAGSKAGAGAGAGRADGEVKSSESISASIWSILLDKTSGSGLAGTGLAPSGLAGAGLPAGPLGGGSPFLLKIENATSVVALIVRSVGGVPGPVPLLRRHASL